MSEEQPLEATTQQEGLSNKALLVGLALTVALAVALSFVWHSVITPKLSNREATKQLQSFQLEPLEVKNREVVGFKGERIDTVNSSQKALGEGGKATTPPAIVFTSSNSRNKRVLDYYLDYSSPQSRDFFILNQKTLKNLVESGRLEVRVHPLLNGKPLGIYGFEAASESVSTSPEATWNFLFTLAREAASLEKNTPEEVAAFTADVATKAGIKGVGVDSIKRGTYASWLASIGNDPRTTGTIPTPAVYLDDKLLDATRLNLNDSATLRKEVLR